MNIDAIWQLAAGLGIFLLGMSLIEQALSKLGGRHLRLFLQRHTKNPVKAAIGGTIATAILQSSSVISLIVLAFVGARVIEMQNALGIIIGANLGTTFTGWIVAFLGFKVEIEVFAYPLIAIGLLAMTVLPSGRGLHQHAKVVAGFGLLFFGLGFMKASMEGFAQSLDLSSFQNYGIIVYFLVGVIFTAIIQSSSATMALTLSALNMHFVTLESAAALIIGADLGTTITVLLGAVGGTAAKKRVALFHLIFNLAVDLATLLSLKHLLVAVQWVIPSNNPLFVLVGFHNLFNVLGILFFLPFLTYIAKWLSHRFTYLEVSPAKFISNVAPSVVEPALTALGLEVRRLTTMVARLNMRWTHLEGSTFRIESDELLDRVCGRNNLKERYNYIKRLEGEILHYMVAMRQIDEPNGLNADLDNWTAAVRDAVRSVKAIKNVRHDVEHFEMIADPAEKQQYQAIIAGLRQFYLEFSDVWNSEDPDAKFEELIELQEIIENQYDKQLKAIYASVETSKIRKEEISTLLNVIRQLHTSNSALLGAAKNAYLTDDQTRIFDNLPRVSH